MEARYVGIDVAGGRNTWVCGICVTSDGLQIDIAPKPMGFRDIVRLFRSRDIHGASIDAQLTWSLSPDTGYRASDLELRQLIPKELRNGVQSQNNLLAVPARGRQLAEYIRPYVGALVETHPTACLYLSNPDCISELRWYKDSRRARRHPDHSIEIVRASREALWRRWVSNFEIRGEIPASVTDGGVDALVCATVAHLFASRPSAIRLLGHGKSVRGHCPFVVFDGRRT